LSGRPAIFQVFVGFDTSVPHFGHLAIVFFSSVYYGSWFVLLNKKLSFASHLKTVICLNRLRFCPSLSEMLVAILILECFLWQNMPELLTKCAKTFFTAD